MHAFVSLPSVKCQKGSKFIGEKLSLVARNTEGFVENRWQLGLEECNPDNPSHVEMKPPEKGEATSR